MFLRNYWYVAAASQEVSQTPLGRIILNEPVVIFRTAAGIAAALEDRCCHRHAPLHLGRVVGEHLQCGYHGLEFDRSGRCALIPAQEHIPPTARVKSYPVVERYRWLWIWMGDPALADPNKIADFHWLDDSQWGARSARLPVECNWQLIVDNLLDLTHLTYVHGATIGTQANTLHAETTVEHEAERVRVIRWTIDQPAPPTFVRTAGFTSNVDRWQIIEFEPPAFVRLDVGAAPTGQGARQGNRANGLSMYNLNAITPETERSSHYFWGQAQSYAPKDEDLTERVFEEIKKTFDQDWHLLQEQQRAIERDPTRAMVSIRADAGPIAARRILERLAQQEAGGVVPVHAAHGRQAGARAPR
ncbi:MAG TPA: aromatic ring-hydroxylating dioxygenase subunit alpha [Candidatus Binataceae bacterium]|nr:aromatic ring-hydroxylating dioxygenase subunit alpha [Candidatus Binataceae bacterium]